MISNERLSDTALTKSTLREIGIGKILQYAGEGRKACLGEGYVPQIACRKTSYKFRVASARSRQKTANFHPKATECAPHKGAAWRALRKGASRCLQLGCVEFAPLLVCGSK